MHGYSYEMHDALTAKASGAGYFRLHAEIDVTAELFIALMMDTHALMAMDHTVRAMDFVATYPDKQTWLT